MKNDDLPQYAAIAGSEGVRELSADEALALDLALGILAATLRDQAVDRCGRDEAFGSLVASYREMLGRADDSESFDVDDRAGIPPSDTTWAAVQARIAQGKDG